MSQNPELPLPMTSTPNMITCSNCRSSMPAELRFCRNCGFRLGEGSGEFAETTRFGGEMPGAPARVSGAVKAKKQRRKMSGMAWIFVGLLIFFIGAAAFTAVISPMKRHAGITQPVNKSYAGTNEWESTETGGATFNN